MRRRREREVVEIIPSDVVTGWMLPMDSPPIEVREKRDGSYAVYYPDEGWLPCLADCALKHKHEQVRPYVQSYYVPSSFEDAMEFARWMAGRREVKVVRYHPPQKSKTKKAKKVKKAKTPDS